MKDEQGNAYKTAEEAFMAKKDRLCPSRDDRWFEELEKLIAQKEMENMRQDNQNEPDANKEPDVDFHNDNYDEPTDQPRATQATLLEKIKKLNKGQRLIFNKHQEWVEIDSKRKVDDPEPEPMLMFVSGPAGTGKSYLLDTIEECYRVF